MIEFDVMFARLTTTVLGPDEPEAAAEIIERILPTLESLDGFKGVLVLADEKTKLVHGITLWESAAAMERSEPVMKGMREAETRARHVIAQETAPFRVAAFHLIRSQRPRR
jgi:heme-degrading monooxygenase HmoA